MYNFSAAAVYTNTPGTQTVLAIDCDVTRGKRRLHHNYYERYTLLWYIKVYTRVLLVIL